MKQIAISIVINIE